MSPDQVKSGSDGRWIWSGSLDPDLVEFGSGSIRIKLNLDQVEFGSRTG